MENERKIAKDTFQSKKEAKEVVRNFQLIAVTAALVLVGGTVFYHYVEDLKWLDSFYFCVVSLTTVGYGDITPKTDLGKLFTTFYLIIGIAIIAALLNNLIKSRLAKKALDQFNHEDK